MQWIVFEPHGEPLWANTRPGVGVFMNDLFREGACPGKTPDESDFVKCDRGAMTQDDINTGIVTIEVGLAPARPAEFVVISIRQMARQMQD